MKYPLHHYSIVWDEPKLWFQKRFWKFDFEGKDYILKVRFGIVFLFTNKRLW